jgi:hypothetical protein
MTALWQRRGNVSDVDRELVEKRFGGQLVRSRERFRVATRANDQFGSAC